MEEDELPGPMSPDGPFADSPDQPRAPKWAQPARRADLLGDLAHRLCASPPDFTAGPPLVEAVREREGDGAADALASELVAMLQNVPTRAVVDPISHPQMLARIPSELRGRLRRVCASYLYDLTSACGILARIVEMASEPVAPPETRAAQLDVVMVRVPVGYSRGDRISMPDGRSGVIVTDRGPDGRAGVMPTENNGPATMAGSGEGYDPDSL